MNYRTRQAAIVSAALAALASISPITHAATVTWTGVVTDPSSGPAGVYDLTDQGTRAGFVEDQNLYLWNTSAANWTGDSSTYTVGDNVVFTDNVSGGKDIRLSSSNLNPSSITFVHIPGTTPVTYRFTNSTGTVGNADFYSDATHNANLSANTPFGSGASATLTLDTGFLGHVILRQRSNSAALNGNTIVRSGILEINDALALNGGATQNAANLTLDGGEFRVNVSTGGNTNPASSNLTGTLTVLSDSILSNGSNATANGPATNNNSRVWNGPVVMSDGVTLTLESINANARVDLSNMNLTNTAGGTIKLQDFGGNTTVVALQGNNNRSPNVAWDLGTGASELLSSTGNNTFNLGSLTGGAGTFLSGSTSASTTTTYQIGERNDNSTYAGTVRDNSTQSTGLAAITKAGAGTLTLTGANTYTGPTTVNAGTLQVSGAIGSIAGSAAITVNSAGTLAIDNAVNNNNRLGDAATVSLNQGNLSFVGNLAAPTAEVAGVLTIAGGANTIQTTATGSGSPASLSFASLTRTAGVIDFRPAANVAISLASPPALQNGIIGAYATANSNDWATLSGNNVAAFSAYANNTATATWVAANNINLTAGGTSAVSANATVNSLRFGGPSATVSVAAGQKLDVVTGGVLVTGANAATISGPGAITAGSGSAAELLALVQDPAGTLTLSAPVSDNGAGAVTVIKAGPGKLVLASSASTNTGGTQVLAGTLAAGVANALPTTSDLTLNYGAAFDIAGFNQTFANVVVIDGSLLNTGSSSANVSAATAYDVRKGTVTASLAGAAALTKTTGGTVTLAAANTYTGGTTVSAGTLATTANGAIPNNALTVNGGGTLDIGSTNQTVTSVVIGNGNTNAGTITGSIGTLTAPAFDAQNGTVSAILAGGAGGLTKAAVNTTFTLSGLNTYTGPTVMSTPSTNGGTLSINSIANGGQPSAIGASSNAASNLQLNGGTLLYTGAGNTTDRLFTLGGAFTITNNGTGPLDFTNTGSVDNGGNNLTLNGTGTASLAVAFSNGGGIIKSGTGTWALSGNSSHTGNTTVTQGVLSINAIANGGVNSPIGAASSDASSLVLNGGTLRYTGAGHSTNRLFNLNNSSTLDASGTGAVNFNNASAIGGSIGAAGTLTLTGTSTANNTLAPVIPNVNGQTTSLTKSGSGTWVLAGANTYTGVTAVSGGKLVLQPAAASNVLTNAGGATIADGATLAFDYATSTSPASQILTILQGGASTNFNAGNLKSSPANAQHGLAMTDNTASKVVSLVRAFYGDLNLDGKVNADDYILIDRGAAKHLTGWSNGDFNYDGTVNAADYQKMDAVFINTSVPHDALGLFLAGREAQFGPEYVSSLLASVPEPSVLAVAGFGVSLLTSRRRRGTR